MRTLLLFTAATTLCACQPEASKPDAAKPVVSLTVDAKGAGSSTTSLCMAPVTKEIAFTSPTAKDVLTFEALGADCREATLVTSVRSADGKLLIADGGPAKDTTVFAGIEQEGTKPDAALKQMLDAWLGDMSVKTTADAPDWKDGAPRPEEPSGLYIGTDWPRADYVAERTAKRPMLCLMSFLNRTTCYAWKAEDSAAYRLYDMRS